MPLYIDLHIDSNLTLDIIKQFHVADKATQAKYGVRYLQILLNQPQGYLFCLVEGPDKESCAKVHQEAHGNIACNILEITEADFTALLANKQKDALDFTLNSDGTLDTGTRILLYIDLLGSPDHYRQAKEIMKDVLDQDQVKTGESFENRLIVVFDSSTAAIDKALRIRDKIIESSLPIEIRLALNIGPPLQEKGSFFEAVRKSVDHFSFVSKNGEVTLSSKVMQLYNGSHKSISQAVKFITPADEQFLDHVMQSVEKVWDKNDLTMPDFARELGMSKSQLARKLNALSGLSPNDFLKEYKLRKAIALMEDQKLNIAEVTMAVGFSNPSYFTKCFRKRFGMAPSDYLVIL
ncbi:MAG TPA: nickel-binding protein [Cyclobacteriaceae bacterium]|nr:nickel-binding protein [Cyclobacteriaceae bacterium]